VLQSNYGQTGLPEDGVSRQQNALEQRLYASWNTQCNAQDLVIKW